MRLNRMGNTRDQPAREWRSFRKAAAAMGIVVKTFGCLVPLLSFVLLAQTPGIVPGQAPPPPPEAKAPIDRAKPATEAPKPDAAATEPQPSTPKRVVYRSEGKPIALTDKCGDEEIREYGLVCDEEEPCPILLELTSIEPVSTKLFLVGNFHTENTTLHSLFLMSEDGGVTWTEAYERLRGVVLDQVLFSDFEAGWVSGHVSGALNRDPFLLRTSDGGKTWKKVTPFEEGTYAVIENLAFTSRTEGTMLLTRANSGSNLGRFQKLITHDGGDTWTLQEAMSQPYAKPTVRSAVTTESGWRIRGDARAKVLRIEKRVASTWNLVSGFELPAGVCKPDPRKPVEPAQEAPPPGQGELH